MAPTTEWKKLKKIVSGKTALKSLKSLDPKILKNLQNDHGKTFLHVAAKHASLAVIKYLIEVGLEVNAINEKNTQTPLICALIRNDAESKKIVKHLVNSGADMSWTDIIIGSQSHILFHDNKNIAGLLCLALKKRKGSFQGAADYLHSKGWSFENIAYLQHDNITKCALNNDQILCVNYKKLEKAITNQDIKTINQLFNLVSHSKRITSWLLEHAIDSTTPKSLLMIKLLLNKGAPVNGFIDEQGTPIEKAFFKFDVNKIWILLKHGAELKNFKQFELLSQVFLVGSALSSSMDFSSEKQESVKDCLRILVEHQGVNNSLELIQNLPKNLKVDKRVIPTNFKDISHLRMEYISIVAHCSENYFSALQFFNFYDNNLQYSSYFNKCRVELEEMKEFQLEGGTCLIDLLPMSIDEMIPFTTNDCLMNEIKAESFVDMFPCFGRTLQFKVSKAFEKKLMIDHSIDVLSKCLPNLGSCLPALEKIVHYLDDPYVLSLYWNDFFS